MFGYRIISSAGIEKEHGTIDKPSASWPFDFADKSAGVYFIILTDSRGINYRVKIIKYDN